MARTTLWTPLEPLQQCPQVTYLVRFWLNAIYNMVILTSRQDQPKAHYPLFQYDLPATPTPVNPLCRPVIQRVSL